MPAERTSLFVEILHLLRSPTGLVLTVLTVVGVGLCSWREVLAIVNPNVVPEPVMTPPAPQAPQSTPAYRPFGEYPAVWADALAHPAEARVSVWVSFHHLGPDARREWVARWKPGPALRPVGTDGTLYRFECTGRGAEEFVALMEDYPYALAPGPRTDKPLEEAYRRVVAESPFRVPCVVRGDWLYHAVAAKPALAAALGLHPSPAERDAVLDESLDPAAVFGPDSAIGERLLAEDGPGPLTRRRLEADAGRGSLFVRWAKAAGLGVPAY